MVVVLAVGERVVGAELEVLACRCVVDRDLVLLGETVADDVGRLADGEALGVRVPRIVRIRRVGVDLGGVDGQRAALVRHAVVSLALGAGRSDGIGALGLARLAGQAVADERLGLVVNETRDRGLEGRILLAVVLGGIRRLKRDFLSS